MKNRQEIAIFVSHRIDLNSKCINNPLYINMRCGAVYDTRPNINILGDNTGNNISEKRNSFCEYTVQYWAWKNFDAEYYGLCHYRRYLSFADKYFDFKEPHRFAVEKILNIFSVKKYCLLNKRKMTKEIRKYDVITSVDYPVDSLPFYPKPKNEWELWNNHPHYIVGEKEIKLLLELIKERFPIYYDAALELMNSKVHKGFNCFIMKKDLFTKMCEFEFSILFEMEKKLDFSRYAGNSERTIGYLGEILYGTFMLWLKKQNKYKIKETQIVLFNNTERNIEVYKKMIRDKVKQLMMKIWPSYRVGLRVERNLIKIQNDINNIKKEVNAIKTREQLKFWLNEPVFAKDMDLVKKNFWQSFPEAEGDLRLIQKGNVKLLERLKQLCDKLNVKFWLHGGSLIGSVRHSGFVPWDDDIDIAMMRDDFKKIKNYLTTSIHYEIAEFYYTGLGCRSYRFRRKDLTSNFFVDIFLYDDYECEYNNILDDWKKMRLLKKGLLNQWKEYLFKENIKSFNDYRIDDNLKLKNYLDTLIDRYIDKFRAQNKSEYVTWGIDNNFENATRYAWHHGRIFKYNDIFPLKESVYEGKVYNIPANFEKYAFAEYGIGYLEMPNTIGVSAHLKQYFANSDIEKIYKELIASENEIKEI